MRVARGVAGEVCAFRYRRPLAAPALFAVVGVFAAPLTGTPPIYPAVIAAILAASLVLRPSYWILVLIVGFGFASYTAFRVHHHRSLPLLDELQPGEGIAIEAEGVVASDPQTGSGRGSRSFCFVNLKTVARTDGAPLTARQRVYARLPSSPEIRYGDLI